MFVRIIKKTENGITYKYLKLVENYRDHGRVRQRVIVSLGNIERLSPKKINPLIKGLSKFSDKKLFDPEEFQTKTSRSYGDVLAIKSLWDSLKISDSITNLLKNRKIDTKVSLLVLVMVINRLIAPGSKLAVSRWYKRIYLPELEIEDFDVHQFYKALNYLQDIKEPLEEALYLKIVDLFSLKLDIVFYDLTTTFFQGKGPNIARKGHSKDHRPDKRQILLGLLISKEGIPIAHEVFPGNFSEFNTIKDVIKSLKKRFKIDRCIFVCDKGLVSKGNLKEIKSNNFKYIISIRKRERKGRSLIDPDLSNYKKTEKNLWAKEVKGKDGLRYIICHNSDVAKLEAQTRNKIIAKIKEKLDKLSLAIKEKFIQNENEIITCISNIFSNYHRRRYFTWSYDKNKGFVYSLKKDAIAREEASDGKYIVQTDVKDLSIAEVVKRYKDLQKIEEAFCDIKDFLQIRPIYHYNEKIVRAHVFVCVLSYLIEKVLENKLSKKKVLLTARRALEELEEVKMVENQISDLTINCVTEIGNIQRRILNVLGINNFQRTFVKK